ncbi:MHYT domain-containing protein [Bacillus suaedaesalsae]|uniref:histidine kinase n=1 Tax=Bacillus suaedaesalsae TaxID=2810349 RepID=A0ABS2DJT3_9BACI|nr:MHYT domain-containing protein [Bacillus suaedaesalsae]MBM6618646.1 hypothetical protein [Bacillus suaedaesalsae]
MEHTLHYDWKLVLLSVLIAVLSSFFALDLSSKVSQNPSSQKLKTLVLGAIVMGMGIWCMHFIGMLAYHSTISVKYSLTLTIFSMISAIVASFFSFLTVNLNRLSFGWFIIAGILMGTAISSMHYLGMAAMQVNSAVSYDRFLVLLSILVSVIVSFVSLAVSFYCKPLEQKYHLLKKIIGSLLMGASISSMHYIGMKAFRIHTIEKQHLKPSNQDMFLHLTTSDLGYLISVTSLLILILIIVNAYWDRGLAIKGRILSEEQFKSLFEYNPYLVFTFNESGVISNINKKGKAFLQQSFNHQPIVFYSIFDKNDQPLMKNSFELMLKGEVVLPFIASIQIGEFKHSFSCTLAPIVIDGQFTSGFLLAKDITELTITKQKIQQVQEEKRRKQELNEAILSTMAEGIILFYEDGSFNVLNEQVSELLEIVIDENFNSFDDLTYVDEERVVMDNNDLPYKITLRTNEPVKGKVIGVMSGESIIRWITVNSRPLTTQDKKAALVTFSDITVQKIHEIKLRESHTEILVAKDAAERANSAKSLFLSKMSHELRTPLNSILGFAQLLEIDQSLTSQQHEFIQEILNGGRHLQHLINDVLDLSRIETGSMNLALKSSCLISIIEDSIRMLAPLADNRGISIVFNKIILPHNLVYLDPVRTKQILINLIDNGIKYTRSKGKIIISCSIVKDYVMVSITDNGVGIHEKELIHIFKPFYRINEFTGNGIGIGLTLVKELVNLMNGNVGVESQLGKGSTFWFSLPLALNHEHSKSS